MPPLADVVRNILRLSFAFFAITLVPFRVATFSLGHYDLLTQFDVGGMIFGGILAGYWYWMMRVYVSGGVGGFRGRLEQWCEDYHFSMSIVVSTFLAGFGRLTSGTGLHTFDALFWGHLFATLLLSSWWYGPAELAGEVASPIVASSLMWSVAYLDTRFAHFMITSFEGCPRIMPFSSSSTTMAAASPPAPAPSAPAFHCSLPPITRGDRIVVALVFLILFLYSLAVILVRRDVPPVAHGGGAVDPDVAAAAVGPLVQAHGGGAVDPDVAAAAVGPVVQAHAQQVAPPALPLPVPVAEHVLELGTWIQQRLRIH